MVARSRSIIVSAAQYIIYQYAMRYCATPRIHDPEMLLVIGLQPIKTRAE